MKKSILLSTIMTLVLIIALSTATFAWYGSSTTAVANMTTLTASSGDGNLQISATGTDGWGSSAEFSGSTNPYIPASIKGVAGGEGESATVNAADFASYTNWFKGSKNSDGSTNKVEAMAETDNYVRKYTIYLRNIGTKDIKVNLSGIAFNDASESTDSQAVKDASAQLENQCVYMILNGTDVVCNSEYYATAEAGEKLTGGLKVDAQAPSTTGAITVPAYVDASSVVAITVYNWIDGWKASSELNTNSQLGKVTFTVTFNTYKEPVQA